MKGAFASEAPNGIRSLHVASGSRASSPAQRHQAARGSGTRTYCSRSQSSRSEAKKKTESRQAFRLGLGPRFKVLVAARFSHLACEFGKSQPLAQDARAERVEAVAVVHILPVVVAESLFVNVAEQVEGFDANIGAAQSALEQAPEVLQPIGMDLAANVGLGVVDELVDVFGLESEVSGGFIGEDMGSRFDGCFDVADQSMAAGVGVTENHGFDFAIAFQHALDANFATLAATVTAEHPRLASGVHVPRLAADVGFVNFHFAGELAALVVLHRQPDALKHEPSGLLSDSKSAMDLVRTDSVFAVGNHPHGGKPLVQTNGGILENSPNLDRELSLRMPSLALPETAGGDEGHFVGTASRADRSAVFPASYRQILQAIVSVREVKNRFLEGGWFGSACHESSMREMG